MGVNNALSCIYVGGDCQNSEPCSHDAYAKMLPGTETIDRTKIDTTQFNRKNYRELLKSLGFVHRTRSVLVGILQDSDLHIRGSGTSIYQTFRDVGEPVPSHFAYYEQYLEREEQEKQAQIRKELKYKEWVNDNKDMLDSMYKIFFANYNTSKTSFNKNIYTMSLRLRRF